MIYAVLSPAKNNRRAVSMLLDVDTPITSMNDIMQLPAFAGQTLDWGLDDIVLMPDSLALDKVWHYDVTAKQFAEAPPPRNPIITKLQLFKRLNDQELALLIRPDKVANLPEAAEIRLSIFLAQIREAQEIDLDDETLVNGLNELEQSGLIAPGRAKAIRGI